MFCFAVEFACGNTLLAIASEEREVWAEYPSAVGVECVDSVRNTHPVFPTPPEGEDGYPEPYEGDEDASYGWDECEALDGDAESALASAGYGTDEDYGDYGQYDDWACQYDE